MSNTVLGISAFYHDSAAALVTDGRIIAAAQEERFTRKKHDPRFPEHAINYCLEEAFIEADEIDAVVFYDNPLLTLDRVVKSLLMVAPKGIEQWRKATVSTLGTKLFVTDYVRKMLKTDVKVLFTDHHRAHAASAFYPSPFRNAAILTLDGVGEWATTTLGAGIDSDINILKQINYPHSLGLLYSAFTYFCGFKVNSGEYKLMGLAPYGIPEYVHSIYENLIHVMEDGSFRLNTDYFGFLDSNMMTNSDFNRLFGGPPRQPESRITRREMNIAASIQKVIEDVVLKCARHLKELTGSSDLVMAGGVALNCVANGVLLREKLYDRIWIQPAAGDAGCALGAAFLGSHEFFHLPRVISSSGRDLQNGSYLGPAYTSVEIRSFLDREEYRYRHIEDQTIMARIVAEALSEKKIVGYFAGRMEFGPRSLGTRSILGDARDAETQSTMNLKIKYRESFRPFAPSVLLEKCSEYFELEGESPYMLFVAPVLKERRTSETQEWENEDLLQRVNQQRSDIPAVTHVDYSARVQTVNPEDNKHLYNIIKEFEAITGSAVVVNTSFNVRGEPIVCTPQDAYRCFMRTEMDVLVLEDCILYKEDQPETIIDDSWKDEYELD